MSAANLHDQMLQPISVEQELARVLPVIEALHNVLPAEVMISIDTYKAEVAEQALQAGACIINDIWGLRMILRWRQLPVNMRSQSS